MGVLRSLTHGAMVAIALSFAAPVPGQESSPGVPAEAENQAQRWLDVFNSGDFAAMEQLQSEVHSGEVARQHAIEMYQIRLITGGIETAGLEQRSKNEVAFTGTAKLTGNQVQLMLRTNRDVPDFAGLQLLNSPEIQAARAAMSEEEAIDELDTKLRRLAEADEFSGAALILKDGDVIYEKALGIANKTSGALNRTNTKFNLASAGKMFTAAAILQLVQEGKLSLDDAVGKILPGYDNEAVREKVTVRHLLTHTSGMGDIFGESFKARRAELRTVADFVSLFETAPLEFEPGTQWSYSNAGFCLLGAIIEHVSGEDYHEYLQRHLFDPLGMQNTGAFESDQPVDNLAIGYTRMGATTPEALRERLDNTDLHTVKGSPAGGGYSTVEDLAKLATALQTHQLLGEELTQSAMSAQPNTIQRRRGPIEVAYGLGFQVESVNGHTVVGHGGGFPGISSSFFMYPESGYVIIVLSNYDRIAAMLGMEVRDWIVAKKSNSE